MTQRDDLVSRLRDESVRLSWNSIERGCADSGIASNVADDAIDMLTDDATALEAQADDIAVKESAIAECARTIHKLMTRALAAESSLAEARRVIEPFAREADEQDHRNPKALDDLTTVGQFTIGQCRAARDFINAKEKTDAR